MAYREYTNLKTYLKVYEDGTIEGTVNKKTIKQCEDEEGYLRINTGWCHGRIHQIVYCLFNELSRIPKGYVVHHIDKNKQNNALSNLKLVTHKEHADIHYDDKFTKKNRQIFSDRMNENNPMKNPETVKKVVEKLTGREGRKLTDEEKQMHSERMKENNPMKNPEIAAKSGEAKRGIPLSEEHKQHISEGVTGIKRSEETKQKISESKQGEKNPAFGRKWMNNKYYKIYAKPEWIEKLLAKGFEFGYKKSLPKYALSNII